MIIRSIITSVLTWNEEAAFGIVASIYSMLIFRWLWMSLEIGNINNHILAILSNCSINN